MPENDDQERQLLDRLSANLKAADAALKEATSKPTVAGSAGQPKANPLFNVAREADELALRLSQELRELRRLREQDTRGLTSESPRLR